MAAPKRLKQTPNRPCSKCGATMANGFDIEVEDGKAYQVSWLECDECGHALKPKRKYLGLEADMWPDYEPDEDEPDPNPYREVGMSQSDF
jgi:hypothetical protein